MIVVSDVQDEQLPIRPERTGIYHPPVPPAPSQIASCTVVESIMPCVADVRSPSSSPKDAGECTGDGPVQDFPFRSENAKAWRQSVGIGFASVRGELSGAFHAVSLGLGGAFFLRQPVLASSAALRTESICLPSAGNQIFHAFRPARPAVSSGLLFRRPECSWFCWAASFCFSSSDQQLEAFLFLSLLLQGCDQQLTLVRYRRPDGRSAPARSDHQAVSALAEYREPRHRAEWHCAPRTAHLRG